MYSITYSLQADKTNSDEFYNVASLFTDEVIEQAVGLLGHVIDEYMSYLLPSADTDKKASPSGIGCTYEEAVLELLLLSVLWRIYGGDALGIEDMPRNMLALLAEMRHHIDNLKPGIDFLRGIMSTLFLSPDLYDNLQLITPNAGNLDKLLLWLESTGEFTLEVKRLRRWQDYMSGLQGTKADDIIATAITFGLWFENMSEERLGKYTANIDRYLNEKRPERYWHEDVIFCGRRRVEYHLNMVGAEIMNRAFRKTFLGAAKKLLLLPACMRLLPGAKCRAVSLGRNTGCTGCTPECQVNRLFSLGRKLDFDVAIVSHESSISSNKEKGLSFDPNTGVIGVACVLNLISGGWKLAEIGVPAQCVLLDYCGCKNHWHSEGIPTRINIDRLSKILMIPDKGNGMGTGKVNYNDNENDNDKGTAEKLLT